MERNRSGSNSGGVVKNRSSSGCLIVKKKSEGVVGGSSGGRKRRDLVEEKVRVGLRGGDSVSSDEELLDTYRRREVSRPDRISSTPLVYKRGVGNHGDYGNKTSDFDDVVFGRMKDVGIHRNSLDVYDFDEYDDLSDVERMGVKHYYDRDVGGSGSRFLTPKHELKSGSGSEFGSGSSKGDIIYRRRNSFGGGRSGAKSNDSVQLPVLTGKDKIGGSSESIRLQGKNGVLKVRVKHNKEKGDQQRPQNHVRLEGNKNISRSRGTGSENIAMSSSVYSERKLQKKPMVIGRLDKVPERKRKSVSAKSSEDSDGKSEDSDSSPQLPSDSLGVHRPIKKGRIGVNIPMSEDTQKIKPNGRKVRRGCGTEKQKLREKIRNMLVSAGWTIDYRPRRGRDYSDAVYVNPVGTAYWSIIKAYEALQKQLEDEGTGLDPGDGFDSIADDIMSKLTRQTKRKMEKELMRKKREEVGRKRKKQSRTNSEDEWDTDSNGSGKHDDKLSSFIKRNRKSLKGASKEAYYRDESFRSIQAKERGEKSFPTSNIRLIHGRESTKIGRCTLLVRNAEKRLDSNSDGFVPYTGKRNLLSWLIDSGTVKLSQKVHYMNRRRTRVMLEGWIAKDGIHCGCCSKIISISKFEIHASSKLRQPFQNIYLSSGASLLQCQVDAWNRQDVSQRNGFYEINVDGDDPNDDTCSICGDGGNLICCDSCPSTYHQNCLGIQMLPPGDWHCAHCCCRFCGLANGSLIEENDANEHALLSCNMCEGKYHASCIEEIVDTPANSDPPSFCGKKCQEMFEHLQKLLGVKHELDGGLCWSLIHRTDLDSDTASLRHPQRVEWNSKIAVALTVMEECFLPIIDRRSGFNMIHNVLYNCGSNFTRLNYSSFYTVILEKGDEVISAASIRIRGNQCAEMPFIGTRHIYRHQGMCRRLFSAIESTLRALKIEKLIIPAISELMDTWTRVFGFSSLGDKDKIELSTLNMMAFPGTDMLQKKLVDYDSLSRNLAGEPSLEAGHVTSVMSDLPNKYELNTSPEPSRAAALSDNYVKTDQSVADFSFQDAVASVGETSLLNASKDIENEVKPGDFSRSIKPVTTTEGGQGTIGSSLQPITKCDESSSEAKVRNSSKAPADVLGIGIAPSNMTQDVTKTETGTRSSESDIPTSDPSDAMLAGFLGNDDHAVPNEILCSENGTSADMEPCSLSETPCGVGTMEKPSTSLTAEGIIQDSIKAEGCSLSETPCDVGTVDKTSTSLPAKGIVPDPIIVEKTSTSLPAEGIVPEPIIVEQTSTSLPAEGIVPEPIIVEQKSTSLPAEGIVPEPIIVEQTSTSLPAEGIVSEPIIVEKTSTSLPADGIVPEPIIVEKIITSLPAEGIVPEPIIVEKTSTSLPAEGIVPEPIIVEKTSTSLPAEGIVPDPIIVEKTSTSLPIEGVVPDPIIVEKTITSLPAEGIFPDPIVVEQTSTSLPAEGVVPEDIIVEKTSTSLSAEGIVPDPIKAELCFLSDAYCDVGTVEKPSTCLPAEIKAEPSSSSDTSCDVGIVEKPSTSLPVEEIIQDSVQAEHFSSSDTCSDVGSVEKPSTTAEGIIQDSIKPDSCSLSETSCDAGTMENLSISLPAEVIVEDSIKAEVSAGPEIHGQVADLCSSLQTTELLTAPAEGVDRDAVVLEPRPESCNGDSSQLDFGGTHHGNSSIQSVGNWEISGQNSETVGLNNCHNNPLGESKIQLEMPLDSFAEGNDQPFSKGEALHGHDILKLPNVQSENRLSCEPSAKIDDSCNPKESTGQTSEGEMHHKLNISVEFAGPQSANKVEANSPFDENLASL